MTTHILCTPAATPGPAPARPAGSPEGLPGERLVEPVRWLIDLPVIIVCQTFFVAAVVGSGLWAPAVVAGYLVVTAVIVIRPRRHSRLTTSARARAWLTLPWDLTWSTLLRYSLGKSSGRIALVIGVGCIIAATAQTCQTAGFLGLGMSAWFTYMAIVRPLLSWYAAPIAK